MTHGCTVIPPCFVLSSLLCASPQLPEVMRQVLHKRPRVQAPLWRHALGWVAMRLAVLMPRARLFAGMRRSLAFLPIP